METRTCKTCKNIKLLDDFSKGKNKKNGKETIYFYKICKNCDKDRVNSKNKKYKEKNRLKIAASQKAYHKINKKNDALTKKKWYDNNKNSILLKINKWKCEKRKNDISFRLKEFASIQIRQAINKNRNSIKKYLPYSMIELKQHLESKFELWMNWTNWGKYNYKTWDDNDKTTWKWNIDHIIPQSFFKFSSMADDEFKKCWALENLRPYSAKQNILDGNRRVLI